MDTSNSFHCNSIRHHSPCKASIPSLRFCINPHLFSKLPLKGKKTTAAMNRTSKLLHLSFGLTKSLSSIHYTRLTGLTLTQVNHFSNFTKFNPTFIPAKPCVSYSYGNPFNAQQNVFFSSKPQSFVSLVLSDDCWSEKIEGDLDKLSPEWTHEAVMYVLVNLTTNPLKCLDFFRWVCEKKGFCPSVSPYIRVLMALARKEFMVEFWKVFEELKSKGFYIDYREYSLVNIKLTSDKLHEESNKWTRGYKDMMKMDPEKDVANEVLELILSNDWGDEVKGELKKTLEFPLRENFLYRMIVELWKQPLKALKFFDWIGSCGGYEHDGVTYNTMAQVLAQPHSLREFWDIVKRMRLEGYEIDIHTYMRSKNHLPVRVTVELFEIMMDGPYKPSLGHTISLLGKITRELDPDLDLVYRVFNKFVKAGNAPTKNLYDCIQGTLCSLGRFDEAKKIVEDMRNHGFKPDEVTYCREVIGLCKVGKFDEACKVLEQMEADGCIPNVETQKMLIGGHSEANKVDQALSCYEKMKEKNVIPIAKTLTVLLKGFIFENRVLDAYRFLTELVRKGSDLKPGKEAYKLMIEKLAEAGKIDEALDILILMKKHQYPVFRQPIIQCISKCGTVDDAKKLFEVLPPSARSAIQTYSKVIEAFIEQARFSEAKDFLDSSPCDVRQEKTILQLFV